MTAIACNGAFASSAFPAAMGAVWNRGSHVSLRAREMREQPAFARSARWVGGVEGKSNGEFLSESRNAANFRFSLIAAHAEKQKRPMANRLIERGLRIRILTGFSLVILLTLFIAGWSYYHISTLGTAAEHLFVENYRSIGYMHTMELTLTDINEAITFREAGGWQNADERFRKQLALEYANITEPGELSATKAIERDYNAFITILTLANTNPTPENFGRLHGASRTVRDDCEVILGMNERAMLTRAEAIKEQGQFARNSSLVVTVLLVGMAIFLAVAVSRRSLAEFQELDRAKSNFVATAAHELKNPLSSIKTTSALLRDGIAGPLNEKQTDLLSTIHTESNRLLNLVRELLDLAKLETGTLELHRTTVDADTLIESAALPTALRAEEAKVTIDVAVMPDVPELNVDPNKMAWAITNLLSNAVRYSPRGDSVSVNASVIEREVWISVTDRGKGIAEKDIGRIFDKFVQVEEGAMGAGSGSGLGLSIAREIVQAHGGRIWATSRVGHGSTFTIALPLKT